MVSVNRNDCVVSIWNAYPKNTPSRFLQVVRRTYIVATVDHKTGMGGRKQMRSIEQVARFAIAVYSEYCNRGISTDIAREKAVTEVIECTAGVALVNTSNDEV